ncbi:MAG: FAD-dependent thymidylate synthase [Spirochaetales bacterium]|nr:FAD-dependent thymidylate synthase [Spirochaetales bacterium]
MAHSYVKDAELILDKEFKVLDKGFVRLVDYMGSDDRIVQSARVSYGSGTKSYREDKGLINYLLRNEHTSPFEQVVLTFHVKLPIFVARQWIRHRTARLNEISGRYSIMKNEFYLPDLSDISFQSQDNKQGRSTEEVPEETKEKVLNILKKGQDSIYADYQDILDDDIARELARINLPLSTYTEWYWQIDLHNLFHFLRLRLDSHAQKEIRDYSEVLLEICKKVAPIATEAFEIQVKGSCRLASYEIDAVRSMLNGEPSPLEGRDKEILMQKLGL